MATSDLRSVVCSRIVRFSLHCLLYTADALSVMVRSTFEARLGSK